MADTRLLVPRPIEPPQLLAPDWAQSSGPDLQELFRRIWRRKLMIATIAVGCTLLTAAALFAIAPRYTATAQVMLDPSQSKLLDANQALAGLSPDTEAVNSAIAVVQSRDLADRVIDKLELMRDPDFNTALEPPTWFSSLLDPHTYLPADWADSIAKLLSNDAGSPPDEVRRNHNRVVEAFLKRLDAGAAGESRVVSVSFQAENPRTAAKIANAIVEEYISSGVEQRTASSKEVNVWLTQQLDTLREQVVAADQAVEDYRTKNGLIESRGDTLATQESAELGTQLVMARTDRAAAEAKLQQVQSLLNSPQGTESAGAVLQSPLIQGLRAQEAQVEQTIADLSQTYGERHPKILGAKAQLADLQGKIRQEIGRIVKDYTNEVAVARAREVSISSSLEQTRSQVASQNQSDVHLRSLEREADASRTLLENFLAQYQQTGSQQSFKQPDAIIISHASEPEKPSFPKKRILLVLALGAFGMLGVLIALLIEEFDRGLRSLGQVERVLGVRGLGLIPTVQTWLGRLRKPEDYVVEKPASALSEALRSLHTGIALSARSEVARTVMFASSLPKEGKTSLALSYARVLAHAGKKVVVVDCDLRRSALCRRLGLRRKAGLSDYIRGTAELDDIIHPDPRSTALIVPAGTAPATSATDILASERLAAFLRALAEHYDMVVIDTPPVLAVSDTQLLSRLVDKTVFVVRWEKTRAETAALAVRALHDAGADIAGVVLSMVNLKRHARYGYGDAGSYYAELRRYYVG
ncbi:GumC family protein [Hypericibacter terrae]|uniref:GumC family protein n=1 Tax=Hypericibacter terrae TaxID=2602015 RepID=UPI001246CE9B|nr:polysaccharide biosynthesis tyrosine autokinase [Hypericibacter terrae]